LYIADKVDILKSEIDNEVEFEEEKGKIKGNILELLKKTKLISMILAPIIQKPNALINVPVPFRTDPI
jgi:hypothetical protein